MTVPQKQTGTAPVMPPAMPLTEFERLLKADVKSKIEFQPFGSEGKITLSVEIVRKYIAVPDDGKLPDDRQCMKFLMLCRSRGLNPFEGDAYMIPFRARGGTEWSLITAHQAFLKRAEVNPNYDGKESGVIINPIACKPCQGDGRLGDAVCPACSGKGFIDELEGDFVPAQINGEEVQLVGGWCKVHLKGRIKPEYQRLKLDTYKKTFGVWVNDPAGMICKCAEAAALRSAFPTMLGGLMLREEMHGDTETAFAAPAMATAGTAAAAKGKTKAPTGNFDPRTYKGDTVPARTELFPEPEPSNGQEDNPEAKQPGPTVQEVEKQKAVVVATEPRPMLVSVRKLCTMGKIGEGKVLEYVAGIGLTDGSPTSLDELPEEQLATIHDNWLKVASEIKKNLL